MSTGEFLPNDNAYNLTILGSAIVTGGTLGGSGTGDAIVSPIFVIVDMENTEDFYLYFKP